MRSRKLILFVGTVNTGKTTQILEMIHAYKHGKVLIYDKQNEPKYKQFAEIPYQAIKNQIKGIYRMFHPDYKMILSEISAKFRDGLIILEDASSYLKSGQNMDVMDLIISRRHYHTDIIMTFHSLNRIPPYLLENLDILVLFKTNDNLGPSIKDSIPKPDAVRHYFDKIEGSADPHKFEILDLTGATLNPA